MCETHKFPEPTSSCLAHVPWFGPLKGREGGLSDQRERGVVTFRFRWTGFPRTVYSARLTIYVAKKTSRLIHHILDLMRHPTGTWAKSCLYIEVWQIEALAR